MTYSKQTWVNGSGGGTPISAARLNYMEDGIEDASEGTVLSVDGTPVSTYDLDTTPPAPSDLVPPAYSQDEVDAAIAAGGGAGDVTLTGTQTLTNKTLTDPRINTIKDTNGANALIVSATASAVNYLQIRNRAAGIAPSLEAVGSDSNITINVVPKGTGALGLYAATGQTPTVSAQGADTNHNLNLVPKGTGVVQANGQTVYSVGGTDVSLADGGTGASLADPGADRLMFWDESANAVTWLTIGTNLSITGTTLDATVGPDDVGQNYYVPGYISGQYYMCNSLSSVGTGTLTYSRVRVLPWIVTASLSITRLFAEFTIAGDANSLFRIGVWSDDGSGRPGSLLFEASSISTGTGNAGTVATGGASGVYEMTVSQTIPPGMYWVGGVAQGTGTQPTFRVATNTVVTTFTPLGTTLPTTGATGGGFFLDGVTGALGSLAGCTPGSTTTPRIGFKVA